MKAILEFDLPEERYDFYLAVKGFEWYSAMYDLDQHLRSKVKYDDSLTDEQYIVYDGIREKLHDILYDRGISFEEII